MSYQNSAFAPNFCDTSIGLLHPIGRTPADLISLQHYSHQCKFFWLCQIITSCICTAWQSGVIIVCAYAQCCSFTGLLRFTRNDNPSPSVICSLLYLGGIKTGGIVACLFVANTRPIIAYMGYMCRNLYHVVIVPSCALYTHAYCQHNYAYHYD